MVKIDELLLEKLGNPLTAHLLTMWVGPVAGMLGGATLELGLARLRDIRDRRPAERLMKGMADSIVYQLVPLFEREAGMSHDMSVEAVACELRDTLDGMVSSELVIARELDPTKLAAAFREHRALPQGHFREAETALYERSLNEVARYLVEVASQLPRFKEVEVKAQLQKLHHLQDTLDKILEPIRKMAETVWALAPQKTHPLFETAYRQAVARNVDQLDLFGVDVHQAVKRYALSVAYIPLGLQEETSQEETLTQKGLEEILDTLPADSMRLLVRGQAGSGKSTLFRWAAMKAALEAQTTPMDERRLLAATPENGQGTWRTHVPFLLRLRSCTDGKLPPLEELTLHTAPELGKAPEGWVRSVLDEGRALLLIDGVDEVPRNLRHTVEEEVGRFVNTYPRCGYLLSTRPTAVPPRWLKHLGFQEAEVTPLSVLDRERLIDHWHRAVTLKLEKVGVSSEDLPSLAQELKATLRRGPTIARLTTTPLLTAVICALHRERNQRLPETRDELCEALCQMLLHRRESESLDLSGFPEVYRKLSYPDKKNILRALAHDMVLNGRSELDKDRAVHEVGQMSELLGKPYSDGPAILEGLIERSGMLREPGPEKVDFIHNTFKEYLAAEVLTERGHDGLLARNVLDPDWKPVLVFAMMKGSESFNASLIHQVLSSPRSVPEISEEVTGSVRERQLMAVLLEASARRLKKEERENVARLRQRLFPPATMGEAEMLSSAGDDVVPFLHYRKKLPVRTAAACVRSLRLIGSAAAQDALRGYLNETRWTVVEELALAVEPLDIKLVRQALLAQELPFGRIRSQIRDVSRIISQEAIRASTSSLQSLNLSRTQVQDLLPLASLQHLDLSDTQVQDLSPLASLSSLQHLDLRNTQVQDLSPLASLSSLQHLALLGTQVQDVSPLASLSSLQHLALLGTQVQDLSPLASLSSLQHLDLSGTQVQDLSPLASLSSLQHLALLGTQVQDLSPLASLSSLQHLVLSDTQVQDLSPLASLSSLQHLVLRRTQVQDLSPLASLSFLQRLDLLGTQVQDLSPLASLSSLQRLDLLGTQVQDLSPLASLSFLQSLDFRGTQVQDLSPLSPLSSLQHLDLSGTQVQDLSPLASLSSLKSLDLLGTQVQDLSPLASLSSLQHLVLRSTQVQDLSPLASLSSLQHLDLSGTQVQDLSPLSPLSSLQSLYLRGTQVQDLSSLSANIDKGLRIMR